MVCSITTAHAASITLGWDGSPSPSAVGYKVYYSSSPRAYSAAVNAGNGTSTTISGLQDGGTFYFAVTAFDALGVESDFSNEVSYTFASSSIAPEILVSAPADGAAYTAPATVNIEATATANGHSLGTVQFYNGTTLLAEVATAPYRMTWFNVSGGTYNISARLTYDGGSTRTSAPSTIYVADPLPNITLTAPVVGAVYTAPATLTLAANALAIGHTINKVQFYLGSALIGEAFTAPYTYAWSNVPEGTYSLSARLIYDATSTASSAPITVSVKAPVTVSQDGLPAPWDLVDIGTLPVPGTAQAIQGLYTLSGSGNISGSADNFTYLYQPLTSEGQITIKIHSMQSSDASASAGLMIRETLTPGSKHVFIGASGSGQLVWQRRTATSTGTWFTTSNGGNPADLWLKLVRSGGYIQGYTSSNGSKWSRVNGISASSIGLASNVYIGTAVTAGGSSSVTTVTYSDATAIP